MVALICNKEEREKINNYAQSLMLLVSTFRWLTDAYVVEFFVKDHWRSLPSSWQKALDGLDPNQLASYVLRDKEVRHTTVWPLSLLSFCAATQSLALNRSPTTAMPHPGENSAHQLDHCFKYHVKNKKRHEIQTLADIIHRACCSLKVSRVVDIGGGQGHLTRLLSVGYGLKVMSIEAAGCHVDGAVKVDRKVELLMQRRKKKGVLDLPKSSSSPFHPPVHIVCTINPDISVKEFVEIVDQHMSPTEGKASTQLHQVGYTGEEFLENESNKRHWSEDASEGAKLPMEVTGDASLSVMETCSSQSRLLSNDSNKPLSRAMTNNTGLHHHKTTMSKSNLFSTNYEMRNQMDKTADEEKLITLNTKEQLSVNDNGHWVVNLTQEQKNETNLKSKPNQILYHDSESQTQNVFPTSLRCGAGDLGQIALPESNIDDDPSQNEICNSESNTTLEPFSLIGLHTCGDLGPTILRVFIRCPEAKVLASVGCCYMKMHCVQPMKDLDGAMLDDETIPRTPVAGFPMSEWVKSLCGDKMLTFESTELACHFFDSYYKRLKDNDASLIFQAYRAMLEILIQKEQPNLVKTFAGIKRLKKATASIKKKTNMSFQSYAEAAFRKLGLTFDPLAVQSLEDLHRRHWKRLIAFHSLRLCLAPIIESLILIDRMLFLLENDVESKLTAVFDPFISPRNLLLQATKL